MSIKVIERGSGSHDRIGISELVSSVAGKVREDRVVGVCSVIDATGVFVAIYVPNGKIESYEIAQALQDISKLIPVCEVRSEPCGKAVTLADEKAIEAEEKSVACEDPENPA